MSHPAQLITHARPRPGKRAVAALAAVLLLAIGIPAYLAQTASPASAQTTVTGGLDVSVDPGSTTVGLATITTTVTYTCTDTSAPGGQAQLRVDFDQDGNDTSGELGVPCGSADLNQTQTVSAVQLGMNGSQEVTAAATLDDGGTAVTDTADTVDAVYVHANPEVTFHGNSTIDVSGYYDCSGPTASLVITVSQDNGSYQASGSESFPAFCDVTNHPFTVTIRDFSGDIFTEGNPVSVGVIWQGVTVSASGLTSSTTALILD